MKKYLITAALPYINGVKHLGNLIGSTLPADVYARYLRQNHEEVLFICGTDEHGTPAEIAALEAHLSPQEYCTKMYNKQKDIYGKFGISFDYFGRTSSVTNKVTTQEIFFQLEKNGLIVEKELQQIYSIEENRFLPDRYVIGTCPFCGYQKARGDQCEQCGELLDTNQLINPVSAISGSDKLEIRKSKHLFFRLDQMEPKLRDWINARENWSNVTLGVAKKWLDEGLSARCISRDLSWGVAIPKKGYENKVFYVWFDAPIAYISLTKEWAEEKGDIEQWRKWWIEANNNVQYVQFMAKDNIPFHAIFFPAMVLGSELNWKLVDNIKGFSWLTYEGGKFSTSSKRGVFLDDALNLFPADYWRYFLLINAPESSDFDFNFSEFVATINKDLADILGNLVSRVCALIHKYCASKIPSLYMTDNKDIDTIKSFLEDIVVELDSKIRALKIKEAMKLVRKVWSYGNEYIALNKPWEYAKSDIKTASWILANCIYIIRFSVIIASPFIPHIAKTVLHTIACLDNIENVSGKDVLDYVKFNEGAVIPKTNVLINKIDRSEIEVLRTRFSGI